MESRGVFRRAIHFSDDAQAINKLIQDITWSIRNLTVSTTMYKCLLGFLTWLSDREYAIYWVHSGGKFRTTSLCLDDSILYIGASSCYRASREESWREDRFWVSGSLNITELEYVHLRYSSPSVWNAK